MINKSEIRKKYRLDELEGVIELCEDKLIQATDERGIKEGEDFVTYILYSSGKCFVTCREIIELCQSGYPDGALALSRNLFEQFIVTAYLFYQINDKKDKDILKKYFADYTYQRAKNLKYEAEFIRKSDKDKAEFDAELYNIKTEFAIKKLKDYWWTNENDKSLMALIDYVINNSEKEMELFLRMMHFEYKRACVALHASCIGNVIRIGSNFDGIDDGPWEKGQEYALFLGGASLTYILQNAFLIMGISFGEERETIIDLSLHYHNMIIRSAA